MRYIILETKTDAGKRKIPITDDVAAMFQAIIEDREAPAVEKIIDGYTGFLFYDKEGKPLVAMHWQHRFNNMVNRYNDIYRIQMPNITEVRPNEATHPEFKIALEEAKAKGLTVMEDGFATTGQKQWDEFYKKVQEGTAAHISIAYYYTLSPKTSNTLFTDYYEANKEDYPLLYTRNLFFDGEKFTLTLEDNGSFIRREYGYLKQFETTIPSSYSSKFPETAIYYVLVNDSTASWDDLMMGAFSSQMGDYIPFDIVYCEKE